MHKGRLQFVSIDIDQISPGSRIISRRNILVLASGSAVYNHSGKVDGAAIAAVLDKTLR